MIEKIITVIVKEKEKQLAKDLIDKVVELKLFDGSDIIGRVVSCDPETRMISLFVPLNIEQVDQMRIIDIEER